MQRQMSKQRKRAQLTFVYGLMTFAVVVSVAVLILVILGYRFNRYDGRVEQGGLVQFDSRPVGAAVTLDTIQLANRTPSKITVTAGAHTVTMKKDGYAAWQKNISVQAGSVLWLNYARMLPTQRTTKEVLSQPALTSAVASPDHKWLAVVGTASEPALTVVDLDAAAPTSTKLTLAPIAYTAPAEGTPQTFTVTQWDHDNRYVMVRHIYGDRTEFLSVDSRGVDATVNISALLGVEATDITYSLRGNTIVNVLTSAHDVRQGDLSGRTLSGPLLANVNDVTEFDRSTLVYTTLPDATGARKAGYLTIGASKPRVVRTAAVGTEIRLRIGRYYNTDYVVIAEGVTTEILSGSLVASDSQVGPNWKRTVSIPTATGVDNISFSPSENRFVTIQKDATIMTYDLELAATARSTLPVAPGRPVDWLDSHHISSTSGGTASFTDFDGTNHQVLANKSVVNLPLTISANGKFVYHAVITDGTMSLIRTNLLVD